MRSFKGLLRSRSYEDSLMHCRTVRPQPCEGAPKLRVSVRTSLGDARGRTGSMFAQCGSRGPLVRFFVGAEDHLFEEQQACDFENSSHYEGYRTHILLSSHVVPAYQ